MDKQFWVDRYNKGDAPWDLGQAVPSLVSYLETHATQLLHQGRRAVVPGVGRGYEAALLAEYGFSVVGVDCAAPALVDAMRIHATLAHKIKWIEEDFFAFAQHQTMAFDLFVEHTFFCAISPSLRSDYMDAAATLLCSGGYFIGVFFAHGAPGGPPWTTSYDNLMGYLKKSVFEVEWLDDIANSISDRKGQELLLVARKR